MRALIVFLVLCLALAYASNNTICTNGYQLVNNKCWKLYQTAASHAAAEATCAGDGGMLFMTKNAIDNRAVGTFVSAAGIDHIWMGVFCMGSDKAQCYWDDQTGTTASYDNFATGFPNAGTGRCVYYSVPGSPTGQWLNGDCTEKLAYVCELPTTHSDICDLNFNDYCYFRQDAQPFSLAQQQCERLCGDMVSIHSAEENRFVASVYGAYNYDYIHIGGMATSRDFVLWNDGSTMDYINMEGYNSYACLTMSLKTDSSNSRGAWYANDCSVARHFLCKRPVGAANCRTTPAPPPPTPPTPTCSSGVHMAPGWIATPNYPYSLTSNCHYTLATYGSNRTRFYTSSTSTCPSYGDNVYVYDGDSKDAPRIDYFGGSTGSRSYTSTGNTMFIDLQYRCGGYSGFNASFYSIF